MTKGLTMRLIPALIMVGFAGVAGASGFQLQNQNGAGTSTAYAGAAASAEDASTIFFNPAGMTYLSQGHSISLAGTALHRSVKFSDRGTTRMPVINPATNNPIPGQFHPLGDNGGNGGGLSAIPAGYYSYAISPALRVGVGVSATYGSETEYDDSFAGRFSGRYTSIQQININPSIAYRLNEVVSLGLGVNYAMNEIEFRQATPFITGTGQLGPEGKLAGDGTGWGYNLGAMFQLSPSTRVGLSYRSKIKFDLEGKQKINALGVNRDIEAELETPDNFSIAISQKLSDRWEMLGDLTWTGWSSVKSLEPTLKNGQRATAPLRYNFDDSWRIGLGAKYQYNDAWNLRFGVAYDQTPVPNAESRTMTVPDSDRTWLSFGARWALSKQSSLDFGYAHIFFKDERTNRAVMNTAETATLQTVRGKFKTSADLLSIQYNHAF